MKISKLLLQIAIVGLCFAVGVFGAPIVRNTYAKMFPEPEFIVGNFQTLHQQAGVPVVVFSTKTCPFCEKARTFLKQQNIPHVEYAIDDSDANQILFKEYRGKGVPLFFIGDRRIEGFREAAIVDALHQLKS